MDDCSGSAGDYCNSRIQDAEICDQRGGIYGRWPPRHYYAIIISLLVGVIPTEWFVRSGIYDLHELCRDLKAYKADAHDAAVSNKKEQMLSDNYIDFVKSRNRPQVIPRQVFKNGLKHSSRRVKRTGLCNIRLYEDSFENSFLYFINRY